MNVKSEQPLLIALVGATAVGKTALAIELARRFQGEIISADSRQIYRKMDIGTAKPTDAEQAAARHHLLDLVEPDEAFSLATYQEHAQQTLIDIVARGRLPLLVGGTGQYLAAMLEGWSIPKVAPQPELRTQLLQQAENDGAPALYAQLAAVDPQAAARIEPTNVRRIIRALEVYYVTGQPISAQQRRQTPPYRMLTLHLSMPRADLYQRIDARVEAMMTRGLLGEVQSLQEQGYGWHLPALSSLGYVQFRPYLEGNSNLEDSVQRLKYDTHAFARRQETWFRRFSDRIMLDAQQQANAQQQAESLIIEAAYGSTAG
ncbi:MAG: tRNA (adenosine(37)-N6)-dimethylallyltransferase MiaA [Chloroflexaceae bacterium]|nr:tRNA (adenosine(37)-N6)-dimethylallyltransferase MiaA [Chloroflexaceae bacterium]